MVESRKEQRVAEGESEALRMLPRRILPVPVPVERVAKAMDTEFHPPEAVIERLAVHYGRRNESSAVSGKAIEACTKKDFDCRIASNKEYYKVDWVPLDKNFKTACTMMQS